MMGTLSEFFLIVTNRPARLRKARGEAAPSRRGVIRDLVHVAEDALDPFLQEKPTDNDGRRDPSVAVQVHMGPSG
jgi:hypothetical protein